MPEAISGTFHAIYWKEHPTAIREYLNRGNHYLGHGGLNN